MTFALTDYRGRTAVITGGADGIGLALARVFARGGMKLALLDIRADAAEEAASGLASSFGVEAMGIGCDVADEASVNDAAERVHVAFGRPSLVWANAGLGGGTGFTTTKLETIDWVYGVNLWGVIHTARAFLPEMIENDGPAHFGVTSSSATLHWPSGPSVIYAASKHATMGIAEALYAETQGTHVGFTILCPGLVNTRIWDGARARPERFGGPRHQPEERGERWRRDGMNVDWVAEEALRAMEAGKLYACPQLTGADASFETRVAEIRNGFELTTAADSWAGREA